MVIWKRQNVWLQCKSIRRSAASPKPGILGASANADRVCAAQWLSQQTAQDAQRELERELQKVKLSGQYAKVLKELPILNGTESKEAIIDFFTALETRTTEWSSERIVEVMQIKLKGKAQKATTAAVNRTE
uniref:Uncharacterized protein n=1 Tax=Globodera rostochiensis TaxID=31243 RepID=A0A914I1E2_GLORO